MMPATILTSLIFQQHPQQLIPPGIISRQIHCPVDPRTLLSNPRIKIQIHHQPAQQEVQAFPSLPVEVHVAATPLQPLQ